MFLLQATHEGDMLFTLGIAQNIVAPMAGSTSLPGRREGVHATNSIFESSAHTAIQRSDY